jgi:hypothetical protein
MNSGDLSAEAKIIVPKQYYIGLLEWNEQKINVTRGKTDTCISTEVDVP